MNKLTQLVDQMLVAAGSGPPDVRSAVDQARSQLHRDVMVVVTGRRGSGKTAFVNAMLVEPVLRTGYTAEDQQIRLVASRVDGVPSWASARQVPEHLSAGRSYVEVPEHLTPPDTRGVSMVSEFVPDVIVHVARQRLHSEEREMLRRARREWRLAPFEVMVADLEDAAADDASRYEDVRSLLEAVERLVVARRIAATMQGLGSMAARSDDRTWAASCLDDLERVSLVPEAHILRERWALDACLGRRGEVPSALRHEVVELTLGPRDATPRERQALLSRAGRWRAQASLLPPLAAEVARIVARKLQLDALATPHGVAAPSEGVQP